MISQNIKWMGSKGIVQGTVDRGDGAGAGEG